MHYFQNLKISTASTSTLLMSSVGTARSNLTPAEVSVAGAVSGAVTRLLCQPLDVAKIRLQLQVEVGLMKKYRNLVQLLYTMPREEGITALWKGHVPAQMLSVTYGLASFAVFESLTVKLGSSDLVKENPTYKPIVHFLCGGLGGYAGTVASFPFDVVRTRFVAQNKTVYSSTLNAASQLYREGGIPAFYKGLLPATLAIAPQAGLQFAFYSLFTELLNTLVTSSDSHLGDRITILGSLSCGGLAGMGSKAILYPLDVVKKRLQISGWQDARSGLGATPHYKNMVSCIKKVALNEGILAFYKGFTPALIKAVSTTSLHFMVYEYVCQVMTIRHRIAEKQR